jgi:hypothetical protein
MKQASKAQSKPDKAQCLLLWQALQETTPQGTISSKDGKRYLRSNGSK